MITIYRESGIADGKGELEYRGLSTDTKPTENVTNGAVFIEINTGKVFMFDADSEQWKEF